MLLSQFPLTFHQIQNVMPCFMTVYDYSQANWGSLCDHLRQIPWENIFKLSDTVT